MATKKKYNYNGTLLNLALLGGAALLLKKRTGSLRGIGAVGARDFLERMEEFWSNMYPYSYKDGKNYIIFYKNPDNRAEDFIAFEINKYDTLSK